MPSPVREAIIRDGQIIGWNILESIPMKKPKVKKTHDVVGAVVGVIKNLDTVQDTEAKQYSCQTYSESKKRTNHVYGIPLRLKGYFGYKIKKNRTF